MSDDLEVIMDEDPFLPTHSRHPQGVEEALIYNFFDRDPYTRRHRSRSMADIAVPNAVLHEAVISSSGAVNGVANNSNSNGNGNTLHRIGNGAVVRLMSAEM